METPPKAPSQSLRASFNAFLKKSISSLKTLRSSWLGNENTARSSASSSARSSMPDRPSAHAAKLQETRNENKQNLQDPSNPPLPSQPHNLSFASYELNKNYAQTLIARGEAPLPNKNDIAWQRLASNGSIEGKVVGIYQRSALIESPSNDPSSKNTTYHLVDMRQLGDGVEKKIKTDFASQNGQDKGNLRFTAATGKKLYPSATYTPPKRTSLETTHSDSEKIIGRRNAVRIGGISRYSGAARSFHRL